VEIEIGVIDDLREAVLQAYDRFIGLELSEVAVDGCLTKAQKAEGRRRAAEVRWTEESGASNVLRRSTQRVSP
jgi:hypothetical protein